MIQEGTQGTSTGSGLAGGLNSAGQASASGSKAFYWASKIYNAGAAPPFTEMAGGPTDDYVSDIANRLMGWVG